MSYLNLKAELSRKKITQRQVAEFLGMSENNFGLKVRERVPLTVPEIKSIQFRFFPNATLDYLCVSDGDVPTMREEKLASLDALRGILDEVRASPELYDALADMRSEAEAMTD